ncbi:MAG: hypothetical protein LLG06_12720 [Desulfobacteraceae bacterium]|nr:hypothetical protein [Desulfobacteraceae bacterium]
MASAATDRLIEALKLTTDRINNFLETNRQYFGDTEPSPYGFMTFCSFLVTASYAPPRKYFPNTVVNREERDTEEFKGMVVQSMTQSLLNRHAEAINLMKSEAEKQEHVQRTKQQVAGLVEETHAEYFELFKKDVERLAEDPTNVYAEMSGAFMRDVMGKESAPAADGVSPSPDSLSLGLCLSTTISGLMAFYDNPPNDAQ